MSDETKATIEIIEHYWQKGGFYKDIPVEVMNTITSELEEQDNEIERLNNIIYEFNEFVEEVYNHINQGDESDEFMLIFDKWQELVKKQLENL